ncbi:MAG: PHP domain-containing protein [Chitinivibrionales bacterium]|nr:PHP domain-containing protein [Chitinivibrionales bacterium]
MTKGLENTWRDVPVTEVCGALHLHTTYSDGGSTVHQLIGAAREAGLDYIIITDHETMAARQNGYEGFTNNLFVAVGYEHNDADQKNHYLVIGPANVTGIKGPPQAYIDAVKNDGGVGFLAHPFEKRKFLKNFPSYEWTALSATGYDGIELWNQMSEWLEHLRGNAHLYHLFCPRKFLHRIDAAHLKFWDAQNSRRFVSAVGGVDAHTMRYAWGPLHLTIFPIKVELKGIRTHLYLSAELPRNDIASAKQLVMNALRDGHGFLCNFRRGDARTARIGLWDNAGGFFLPGKTDRQIVLPAVIRVCLPQAGFVKLIHNGLVSAEARGRAAEFKITTPGLYRVEVYKQKNAWIYSNPFPVGAYPLF